MAPYETASKLGELSGNEFVAELLRMQEEEEYISPVDHMMALRSIDDGILGMDGFRYCSKRYAEENFKIIKEDWKWQVGEILKAKAERRSQLPG